MNTYRLPLASFLAFELRRMLLSPGVLIWTLAFPAVEFLCLVGLQRCLPKRNSEARIYDYYTWSEPLTPAVLPAAVIGLLPYAGARGYRFENWFRTGQKKHKAFRPATPLPTGA